MKEDLFELLMGQVGARVGTYNDANFTGDEDYGLTTSKPIMTMMVDGSKEYLNSLRTEEGKKISYSRGMSFSFDDLMVDQYEISADGEDLGSLYLCMYGVSNSKVAPRGFKLEDKPENLVTKPETTKKAEAYQPIKAFTTSEPEPTKKPELKSTIQKPIYNEPTREMMDTVSNDSEIDGLKKKIKKLTVICILLAIAFLAAAGVAAYCGSNYANVTSQLNKVTEERDEQKAKRIEFAPYKAQVLSFYLDSAVVIPDDNSRYYHRAGCPNLDYSKGVWIKNSEAAATDHKKCPKCFGMNAEEFVQKYW